MFYEYAVEPEVVTDREACRVLLHEIGAARGRFLSDFPRRWERSAFAALGGLQVRPVERKRRKELIRKLVRYGRVFKRPAQNWNGAARWIDNVATEHRERPFHAIVCMTGDGQVAELRDCVLDSDGMSDDEALWAAPSSVSVERDPESMERCVGPLLDLSSQVRFVDPHFNPDERRFREPLLAWLGRIAERRLRVPIAVVEYHVCDRVAAEHFCRQARTRLAPLIPEGLSILFFRWPAAEMHNRYVLTNVGGISFGVGLDAHWPGQPQVDEAHRLTDEVRRRLWGQYSGRAPFCSVQARP